MHLAIIAFLMLVLPLASLALDWSLRAEAGDVVLLAGKWFVFWAIGLRLFTAGLRQIVQPAFTATTIFQSTDPAAQVVVQELGFANMAMGTLGMLSLVHSPWTTAGALVGALFMGIAGVRHALHGDRTPTQTVSMVSDLLVALVLAAFLIAAFLRR